MITSGIDRTRIAANVLMLVLVALNIFFSAQYISNINSENDLIEQQALRTEERIETARFLKLFVEKVLGTNGVVSFEDRVKLENDVRALSDDQITAQWENFVESQDGEEAQKKAILLMSLLTNKMIQ
jgi:hypothetical protein